MASIVHARNAGLSTTVGVARFVGIEQEFEVWDGDRRADFREVIHTLAFDGLRLDPGDVNAYRLRSGMVVTCDEAEAEVACPPIPVESGFALAGQQWAASGRLVLERALPHGYSLRGYSTHISVSLPGPPDPAFAQAYARKFGPTVARIVERSDSLGIYVRPRPDRIELCGEFVEGERLGAALAFAAGTVRAHACGDSTPEADIELLPCSERFGYRVHRLAPGFDAYAAGRADELPMADGSTQTFQTILEAADRSARDGLSERASPADFAQLAAIVSGLAPLGVEVRSVESLPQPGEPPPSGYRHATNDWRAGSAAVEPIVATWGFSVFRITSGSKTSYALVPGADLAPFAAALDSDPVGEVQRLVMSAEGELESPAQTKTGGAFRGLASDARSLLEPELLVHGGKAPATGPGRFGKPGGRPGKLSGRPWKFVLLPLPESSPRPAADLPPVIPIAPVPPQSAPPPVVPPPPPPMNPVPPPPAPVPPSPPSGSGPSKGVIAAVGGAIVAVVVVVGAWATSQSGEDPIPTPTPLATVGVVETAKPGEQPASPTATTKPTEQVTPPTATATKATETVLPTVAGAVTTATPVPTVKPTETQPVTSTPTKQTETPLPTATVTPKPTEIPHTPTPTNTVRPTETQPPTKAPVPTATPTRPIDPLPTPVPTATCDPVGGAVCE